MTTVLLTGFEPFGGDAANPSGEAVHLVASAWEGPDTLVTAVLPVAFERASERLRALIAEHSPDIVIATGLAGGRAAVTPERIAVNLIDARIPDNAGAQPIDVPCVDGSPPAYFSSIPVKAIVAAMTDAGIPATLSHTAGTYVCNHVSFVALDEAARRPGLRAGFIHVPWATGQAPADEPELPLADIATALTIAVRTSLATPTDAATPAGTLH
ncbi:pyroglutamyl-peptidase I [Microbacterium awajiense]|uniref:Pyroglutamyl-peptidase I n=1 Tax=Microbacterium awajiense TaxID=415214 RepID=A0ABP7AFQ4_9MICO